MKAKCEWCGKEKDIIPARAKTFRFCSHTCRGAWRSANWKGENHPRWTGGVREKVCQNCGKAFTLKSNQPITTFRKQRFCSHECGVQGRNTTGNKNPNWRGGRAKRPSKQRVWATAVISRDGATCQQCGAMGVELHAHHIHSFKDHPAKRWDLNNGTTLCFKCHWAEHTAINANAVNSGKPLTDNAEGNPEPSPSGNIREGVTTRGRAYRRWEGECAWCGTFLSKRLSDVRGKSFIACSYSCSSKMTQAIRRLRR